VKIIILGAGQVGATLAEHLADEKNDITVIDEHAATLKRLQERLDLRTVLGHGAHPSTLMNAGAEDADMLIAVTDSDEINMLACSVALRCLKRPPKSAVCALLTTSRSKPACLNPALFLSM